ncbi:MAG: YjbE family putative metal transport protein [Alphaproteobacteria bacterium]|nr:YjbE family putative metal transport protein [Alphaproteobacteria bacterium]
MLDLFTQGGFFALLQVILIDIVLAGDNAVVIGMSAAHVDACDRRKVIFWGLAAAVVTRVVLATFVMHLLRFIPLVIAGGILLLWVCSRLWRDVQQASRDHKAQAPGCAAKTAAKQAYRCAGQSHPQAIRRAILNIALADISMSLDNVLAVAGAAMRHWGVLVIGLTLSIALMGLAASLVARVLHKYPWISYAGIFIVLFVALRMIWDGVIRMQGAGWFEPVVRMVGI